MIHQNLLSLSRFKETSVLFVPGAFSPAMCLEARQYILDKESFIIDKYRSDKRGLVCETLEGVDYIKYFEHPFHYDAFFFGRFLTSSILNAASFLLDEDARFVSAEIHSRFPGASGIPPHQDNAYYGLEDGKAVTFYISLDHQNPEGGGLQYLYNNIHNEYSHVNSSLPGFSLQIADQYNLDSFTSFLPIFSPGDCTIHHSRSIHFATSVPLTLSRSFVFRFSFYSTSSIVRLGHSEAYKRAIELNRAKLF